MVFSYGVTVCNERKEIEKLLTLLLHFKRPVDEIVILFDKTSGTEEVEKYVDSILDKHTNITLIKDFFKHHFADWKNLLGKFCIGDYIFQLDADEIITEKFIKILPNLVESNKHIDIFTIGRVNTVDGLTQNHVDKWRWNIQKWENLTKQKIFNTFNRQDLEEFTFLKNNGFIIKVLSIEEGHVEAQYYVPIINFPDTQMRIYRNTSEIKWKNKVHEVLIGHKTFSNLPLNYELCLIHEKEIKKQEKQNSFYDTLT